MREVGVEMGESIASPRDLPAQGALGQAGGIDFEQHEAGPAVEVLGGGLLNLVRGGEVDEAIAGVDRGPWEVAVALAREPVGFAAELVDGGWGHGEGWGLD